MSSAMTNKMLGEVFSDFSGASEVFVDGFSQEIKIKMKIDQIH
jgi:nicotinamide mononucleotide (NMN) deamidase PncC